MEAEHTEGMTVPSPAQGREIIDFVECRAGEGFSLAGATKYFCHERLDRNRGCDQNREGLTLNTLFIPGSADMIVYNE